MSKYDHTDMHQSREKFTHTTSAKKKRAKRVNKINPFTCLTPPHFCACSSQEPLAFGSLV